MWFPKFWGFQPEMSPGQWALPAIRVRGLHRQLVTELELEPGIRIRVFTSFFWSDGVSPADRKLETLASSDRPGQNVLVP